MEALEIAKLAAGWLDAKKAQDLQVIRVRELTVIADYFVLASGTSNTQVKALADEVEYQFSQRGIEPARTEGYRTASWIAMDYGSVIIHIFQKGTRDFYQLERVWADGEQVDLSEIIKPN